MPYDPGCAIRSSARMSPATRGGAEMNSPTRTSRLSGAEVDEYRRLGYVLFQQPVFGAAAFARLGAIFEEDLARYGEDDLDTIHFRDPRLLEFLLSDDILDLVEPLV